MELELLLTACSNVIFIFSDFFNFPFHLPLQNKHSWNTHNISYPFNTLISIVTISSSHYWTQVVDSATQSQIHCNSRLTKHFYYQSGVSVTAEKPLIYDKIDNLGAGSGSGGGGDMCYQAPATAMSTFRHFTTDNASSSAESESSSSALCSSNDKQCPAMQVSVLLTCQGCFF